MESNTEKKPRTNIKKEAKRLKVTTFAQLEEQ